MPSARRDYQRLLPFAETAAPAAENQDLNRAALTAGPVWGHGAEPLDVRQFSRSPMPWLVPHGLPLFTYYTKDRIGDAWAQERGFQAREYLRRTDLVLNSKERLKLLKNREHRREAGHLLKGLFYHYPFQTLEELFRTIPEREYAITRPTLFRLYANHPRYGTSPDNTRLADAVVKWTAAFPHTLREVEAWIAYTRQRSVRGDPRRNNAKWAAEQIDRGLKAAKV